MEEKNLATTLNKPSKNDFKALAFLNKWYENTSHIGGLTNGIFIQDDFYENNTIEDWFDNAYEIIENKKLLEFASSSGSGIYCLWLYDELIGDAPIVFLPHDSSPILLANTMVDFVSLLTVYGEEVYENTDFDTYAIYSWDEEEHWVVDNKENIEEIKRTVQHFIKDYSVELLNIFPKTQEQILNDLHQNTHPSISQFMDNLSLKYTEEN